MSPRATNRAGQRHRAGAGRAHLYPGFRFPQSLSGSSIDEVQLHAGRADNALKLVFERIVVIVQPVLDLQLGCWTREEECAHPPLQDLDRRRSPGVPKKPGLVTGTAWSQVARYVSTLCSCDEPSLILRKSELRKNTECVQSTGLLHLLRAGLS